MQEVIKIATTLHFVILVSHFCDGRFYQIFRNHIIQLFLHTLCQFSWEVEKRDTPNYLFIEKN